jgi:glycosyltransferase involved in cell wall biosynthesis
LKKAVKSVLDQTYTDFEILVSDDGSTDDTPQVVKGFSDKRIRPIRYSNSIGVAAVRNNALINSYGEYIAFLDDDDEWLPSKLEKQVRFLEGTPYRMGVVYTGVKSIDAKPGGLVIIKTPQYRGNILQHLFLNNFITTSSILVKKHCFDEVGLFDTEYMSASDNDMWIRIAQRFEFDYVKEPLVNYYNTEISISRNDKKLIKGLERLMSKYQEQYNANSRAYSNQQFKLGIVYCNSGNMKEGRRAIIKAIQLNPYDMRLYYNLFISTFGTNTFKRIKEIKTKYFPLRIQS